MRDVVAAEYMTIDGVLQDPGGVGEIELGGWSRAYFNEELAEYQRDQLFRSDALLLGRVTFEGFAAAGPSMEEVEGDFSVRMNTLPKYVASRTLDERFRGTEHCCRETCRRRSRSSRSSPATRY